MKDPILQVSGLTACVGDKVILRDIDLTVGRGETHVLMGPNGAGKSTLGYVLTGNPKYTVTQGSVVFHGEDVTGWTADKRARAGMFLSFQEPLEVPGLKLETFIRNAMIQRTGDGLKLWEFKKRLRAAMEVLQMDESYAQRDLNVGFSGGEKKKAEVLQLMLLKPTLAILDETDSGLDVDAVRLASEGIRAFQRENPASALLIITHSTRILESLQVDRTHVCVDGRLVLDGDGSLAERINREGYDQFRRGLEA